MRLLRVRGFTLIEVTLALAVFSMSVVVLTQAFVNALVSLNTLESETNYQSAFRFVRSIVIQEPRLDVLEQGGEIETLSYGTAYWETEIDATQVSDLFKLNLKIKIAPAEKGEKPNIYEQDLFLLRPTWSDPGERAALIAENRDRLHNERLSKDLL